VIVLWFVGLLFLLAWAVGLAVMPHAGWYQHLPLLVALLAIGYKVARPRTARP
jgi:hypothetical protein